MRKIYQYILMAVALVATASCSNELDEALQPVGNGNLQFVVSDFPAFGEGGQTRAIGLEDAGKSAWADGDKILVHLYSQKYGNQAVTLTFGNDEWKSDGGTLSYLKNETPAITAVYAPDCEISENKIVIKEGNEYGMAEYIRANTNIENGTLYISFEGVERNYSRLRIAATENETVTVTTTDFTPAGATSVATEQYILTTDDKGNAYLYGTFAEGGSVKVIGDVTVEHTFTEATVAENSYALFARRGANLTKLTSTYVINDSETHYFYGSGNYGIKVASGSPTIILSDANINVSSGIAISITGGATIIQVVGSENSVTSDNSAGIYVAEESTVTITGNSREDKLIVKGNDGSSAIGGYVINDIFVESANSGNINIRNVTLYAYSESVSSMGTISPGIGSTGSATCQSIIIDNATVYAYGYGASNYSAPAIGNGLDCLGNSASSSPTVTISNNSEVHAHRGGNFSDYIGRAGFITELSGDVIATVDANSTVYCYTGDSDNIDKTIVYDANGTATEQAAE